jgi:hypothetical protein
MSRRRFSLSPERKALLARKQAGLASTSPAAAFTSSLPIERAALSSEHPLSSAQKRLWFLAQRDGCSALYNVPCAARLQGELDPELLRQALEKIVHRHDSLRTTFGHRAGVPFCRIAPRERLEMNLTRLDQLSVEDAEKEALRLATEEAQLPMDLEQGPLFRAQLLQLSSEEWVLLMTLHHIVTDGWSMGVLQRELVLFLTALQQGEDPTPPPLLSQPRDIVQKQERALETTASAEALEWWCQSLREAPPLDLPVEHVVSCDSSGDGAHERFVLSSALSQSLRRLANAQQASVFMLLQTSFATLLSGLSGQRDLTIGTPHANRETSEAEAMIGFFVNTLAFRFQWEKGAGFLQLLQQVREHTLEGFARRNLPFERVVEALNPERHLEQQPLFRVWFALLAPEHAPAVFNYGFRSAVETSAQLPGLVMTPFPVESGVSKFDLVVLLWDSPEGISGTFEYNARLFSKETIRVWLNLWKEMLEQLCQQPEQSVESLSSPFRHWVEGRQEARKEKKQSSLRSRLRSRKKR